MDGALFSISQLRMLAKQVVQAGELSEFQLMQPSSAKVADLGAGAAFPLNQVVLSPDLIEAFLPLRSRDSHKGDYGHVLIIGGNKGMGGAVRLAAEAALRVGAGLVSVATLPENVSLVGAEYPEIMCHGLSSPQVLSPLLERATTLVVGPGMGKDEWAQALFAISLASNLPTVIDADGLNILGKLPSCQANWLLTPHPGEAARLLGVQTQDVQSDRIAAINNLFVLGGIWVLKGAASLIKSNQGELFLCPYGNPGMASGGMGDALSGVIAGLMAQGISLDKAAQLGVLIHAQAGDKAAEQGERGTVASDLIKQLRGIVNPQRRAQ